MKGQRSQEKLGSEFIFQKWFNECICQKGIYMSQKKRILLIEDEEDIAALIKLQAEISGYKLHVEVDGSMDIMRLSGRNPISSFSTSCSRDKTDSMSALK